MGNTSKAGLGLTALALTALGLCACAPERPQPAAGDTPTSVILVVGDGMGPQQLALLMDWADAAGTAPTQFERFADRGVLGLLRTGAADSPVTDSAAAATALACGVAVANGVISVDGDGDALRTCLEDARDQGRMTALVTSTRLTHATPACFAAHVASRSDERTIARQLVNESGVDVLLGGGARFFGGGPDGSAESLFDTAAANGFHVCRTPEELAAAPVEGRLLGVFSKSHLPYAIDRDGNGDVNADGDADGDVPSVPTLTDLTRAALARLREHDKGFFLMIEAGRIDHAGHLNDVAAVLGELREFDEMLGVVEAFRAENPGTLVVVTADHETGGLAATYGKQRVSPETLLAMTEVERSLESIAPPPRAREAVDPALFGVGRRDFYPKYSWWETSRALERSAEFGVSFGTQGHTSTPVVIVAAGPGAHRFAGLHRNVYVGQVLREFMDTPPEIDSR